MPIICFIYNKSVGLILRPHFHIRDSDMKITDLLLKHRLRNIQPDILWPSCSWFGISSADDPLFLPSLPSVFFCSFTIGVKVGQEIRDSRQMILRAPLRRFLMIRPSQHIGESIVFRLDNYHTRLSVVVKVCYTCTSGEGMTITCSTLPFCVIKQRIVYC